MGLGRHVATSGPYSDAVCGVAMVRVSLAAGTYVLVPSTYAPGARAAFRVIVHSAAAGVLVSRRDVARK